MPPDLMSLITLLFRPIAAIAIIIKNLLNSFNGVNMSEFTPRLMDIVVINVVIVGRNDKIFQSGNCFPETIGDINQRDQRDKE